MCVCVCVCVVVLLLQEGRWQEGGWGYEGSRQSLQTEPSWPSVRRWMAAGCGAGSLEHRYSEEGGWEVYIVTKRMVYL